MQKLAVKLSDTSSAIMLAFIIVFSIVTFLAIGALSMIVHNGHCMSNDAFGQYVVDEMAGSATSYVPFAGRWYRLTYEHGKGNPPYTTWLRIPGHDLVCRI